MVVVYSKIPAASTKTSWNGSTYASDVVGVTPFDPPSAVANLAVGPADGESEGDTDGDVDLDGEVETEGEVEGLADTDGDVETEGEVETEGDVEALAMVLLKSTQPESTVSSPPSVKSPLVPPYHMVPVKLVVAVFTAR